MGIPQQVPAYGWLSFHQSNYLYIKYSKAGFTNTVLEYSLGDHSLSCGVHSISIIFLLPSNGECYLIMLVMRMPYILNFGMAGVLHLNILYTNYENYPTVL